MSESAATQSILIIGAGQAGGEVATELRKLGYAGRIVLVGDERQPPYRRPPLSKAFLSGACTEESLYVLQPAALAKHNIEFIGGVRASRIDRAARKVELSDGRSLGYDKLVLATGGRARSLALPGRLLAACAARAEARVHGACIGSGIEFPAFAGRVVAAPDAWFQLPELRFGLIPGAGGTFSIGRRIGRQRTAWLALSGQRIKAPQALAWGLVDAIE